MTNNAITEYVREYLKAAELKRDYTRDIAKTMNVSSNTLRRYIREEGTTMAALMREEKIRRVNEIIATRPNINAKRLAGICGYAYVDSFYRAFRDWFGYGWEQIKSPATAQLP